MEIIFIGALVCVIIALDTTHLFQTMISQPVFACPILGMLFGEPAIGLTMGLIFEVSFLKSIPVGAARFPENTIGSLTATIFLLSINSIKGVNWYYFIAFAIALGIFISFAGMHLTIFHRKSVVNQLIAIEKAAYKKNSGSWLFIRHQIYSLSYYMLLMYFLITISTIVFYYISITCSEYLQVLFRNVNHWWWINAFLLLGFARLMNQYIVFKKGNNEK